MIIKLNDTIVNINNICTAKIYFTITADPINGGSKSNPRINLSFIGCYKETISYKDAELMKNQFNEIINTLK